MRLRILTLYLWNRNQSRWDKAVHRIKPDLGRAKRGFVRINMNICLELWPVFVGGLLAVSQGFSSCSSTGGGVTAAGWCRRCSFSWSSSRVVCSRYGKVPPSPSSSSGAEKVPPLRQDPRPCGQYVARSGLSGNLFYFASLAGVRRTYLAGPASRLTVGQAASLEKVHVSTHTSRPLTTSLPTSCLCLLA